jgi:hypothetical protein
MDFVFALLDRRAPLTAAGFPRFPGILTGVSHGHGSVT